MNVEAVGALKHHLDALDEAARAYDGGRKAEAVRIAEALRAIFHREGPADSLLARAGGRFARVRTTAARPPSGDRHWPALVRWRLQPEQSAFVCEPRLGPSREGRLVAPAYWWEEEPVYLHEAMKFRRRDLVLHETDPLGSASGLPDHYRRLLVAGSWMATLRPPGGVAREIVLYEGSPAALRQMAHEVLNSPEVRTLADGG